MIQIGAKQGCKKHKTLNKMNFKLNKKAGFTLTEIVLVVVVIGLLAAIAIPNWYWFVKVRDEKMNRMPVSLILYRLTAQKSSLLFRTNWMSEPRLRKKVSMDS
jgi:prepilin-type N-terminal cleavage/methylation domain-containing protein